MTSILAVTGLTIAHRGVPLVRGIDLTIAAGETLALVGESGSGKSLTAQSLLGLLPPAFQVSGQAHLAGVTGNILDPVVAQRVRGARLAMIFQEPMSALNPVLTVGEQIAEVLAIHAPHLSPMGQRQRVLQALAEVQLDPERIAASYPHQLSGGQRQRAMIAMALVAEPLLLVADEPTTALDVTVQAEVLALLRALQQRHGMAMLFISHDLAVVAQIADRIAVMQQGAIVETGTSADLLTAPRHPYTQRLLAAQPDRLPPRLRRAPGETLLAAHDLRVYFPIEKGVWRRTVGWVRALDGVDISVRAGEVVAVVGESGSGKSTLGRTLLGLQPLTSGSITLFGQEMAAVPLRAWRPLRRRVQVVFQDPFASLNPKATIGAQIMEPLTVHRIGASRAEQWALAQQAVEAMGLPSDTLHRYPHQFSGGQRQRIAIAKALALQPELIVCDEITSALDVTLQAEILQRLAALVAEQGLALLFITHNMAVVRYLADRVLVLYRGQVVEEKTHAELFAAPEHPYTQRLLAAAQLEPV